MSGFWVSLRMIRLTRINHQNIVVNSDLIEHVESTPDTVLTLTTAQKILVLETVDEVVDRVVEFRRRILQSAFSLSETVPGLES